MQKLPQINIIYNIDKETGMFLKFLNDPNRPQRKKQILEEHPKLKETENKSPEKQKKFIKNYLQDLQKQNKQKTNETVKSLQNILNKNSEKLLTELAKLMDYGWIDNEPDFTAIPTYLPFCPFEKNIFYFSINSYLSNKCDNHHILFTAAHEISHFLLFRILWRNKIEIDGSTRQMLQEILAPVLMNQPELAKIIEHDPDKYFGNNNLSFLYMGKERISLAFKNTYDILRKEGKSFIDILNIFIEVLIELKDDLNKKTDFWNKYGHKIPEDKKLLQIYTEPMTIKRSRKELFLPAA